MNNTLRQWGIVIIITIILLMGCGASHEATKQTTSPKETEEAKQYAEREAPAIETDVNFIPAPRLSTKYFNKLWSVAKMKCHDFGWSVANDDKETRNLICETQSSGNTLTIRVKFADEGVYVDVWMSTTEWALFGGKGQTARTNEYREMKKALQDALSEIQYTSEQINAVDEKVTSTQVPSENSPSASQVGKRLIVIKTANIRSESNTKSKIIKTLKKGTKVEYLDKSGDWFNIKLSTGVTGWVFKSLVAEGK